MNIHIDVDGVLANFSGKVRSVHGANVPKDDSFWGPLAEVPGLFLELPAIPDARLLVSGILALVAAGHTASYLTQAPPLVGCLVTAAADKSLWLSRNMPGSLEAVVVPFGVPKWEHLRPSKDCVLVDDYSFNVSGWRTAGGLGILHRSAAESLEAIHALIALRAARDG